MNQYFMMEETILAYLNLKLFPLPTVNIIILAQNEELRLTNKYNYLVIDFQTNPHQTEGETVSELKMTKRLTNYVNAAPNKSDAGNDRPFKVSQTKERMFH